jgi:hypothetical protein
MPLCREVVCHDFWLAVRSKRGIICLHCMGMTPTGGAGLSGAVAWPLVVGAQQSDCRLGECAGE